ncbi:MAG: helix-turn-helix domain-containing protein [Deltaproteobacteria bacterium]|nr:helix-turn-helix domain-containing protein [Deltaproteobacteria bacterium]MCL5276516.1 helix-turn-helix domain-containing protein [Deltaproteobacteria bacterium]
MSEDTGRKTMSPGQRIRLVRGARTQAEFALLIGKHKDDVIRYEADINAPSLLTLSKIAGIGNVTVEWLLHGK